MRTRLITLIIAVLLALVVWLAYSTYILQLTAQVYHTELQAVLNTVRLRDREITFLSELPEMEPPYNVGVFRATAYSPHDCPESCGMCHDGTPSCTASGTYPRAGRTVAVDPNVIPLGTSLWVEGYGIRVAEDTGGAIRGHRIDIVLEDHAAVSRFGVRDLIVVWPKEESQ